MEKILHFLNNRLVGLIIATLIVLGGMWFILSSFENDITTEIIEGGGQVELTHDEKQALEEFRVKREEQRKVDSIEYQRQFEKNKRKWLEENPPVEFLFDTDRRMDKDYIIWYLKQFPISGDCALVWNQDVICWESKFLRLPTERTEDANYYFNKKQS